MMASMRITVHIISVALLSLTLFVGSAFAECAWVLWEEISDIHSQSITPIKTWGILTALETRTKCEDALTRMWRDALDQENRPSPDKSEMPKRVYSSRGFIEVIQHGQQGEFLGKHTKLYQCLPDTVDPRDPKRK